MPVFRRIYQKTLGHKTTLVSKPLARRDPAARRPPFWWRFIFAKLVTAAAIDCLYNFTELDTSIPGLIEAAKRDIREKSAEQIDRLERSIPKVASAALRNIEDNAEKRLANFEKLCRALRIPRY